jgi:hypothetical protein
LKIGIDLDNTIVIYDDLIRSLVNSLGVPSELISKQDIANYLRINSLENKWTEIQGLIYGSLMYKAKIASNLFDTFLKLIDKDIEIVIISHRTKYSQYDGSYDLHKSAISCLNENIFLRLKEKKIHVYFGETIDEKISIIKNEKVNFFIDDLEKILFHKDFPMFTKRILFTNGVDFNSDHDIQILTNWDLLFKIIKLD